MKRVVLSFIFAFAALIGAILRPELVSMVNVQLVIIVGLALVIVSLIFNPITEYVTVEKWRTYELKPPNSFRYGINFYRNQKASFILADGSVIDGILTGRSDPAGTFTFDIGEGRRRTIPQASLVAVDTDENETPDPMLGWNDTGSLIVPRSCS